MKPSSVSIVASATMMAAVLSTVTPMARAEEGAVWSSKDPGSADAKVITSATVKPKRRKPLYFNAILSGSVLHEDRNNRLTQDGDTTLFTPGLILRLGGVVNDHHLVGVNLQASWVNTRSVADADGRDNALGAVSTYMIGPEYRYLTRFGLYFGGSVNFAVVLADDKLGGGDDDEPECGTADCLDTHLERTDDHAAFGVALVGTIGYEHRFKNNLALSVEGYAGIIQGEDENDINMTNATYGVAVGLGI